MSTDGSREHWNEFRREDERFLKSTGIQEVLTSHGAQFLNVTEEVWGGRTADPQLIRSRVEKKYPPIHHEELYSTIPQIFLNLENPLFVNLAKFKIFNLETNQPFYSLSMKNLFGLIPTPSRQIYHGNEYDGLARSITDMCTVYCALFPTIHLLEAIHRTLFKGCEEFAGPVTDLGLLISSDSPAELDAFAVHLAGGDPNERHFLKMGKEVFGTWDESRFPKPPEHWRTFFTQLGIAWG